MSSPGPKKPSPADEVTRPLGRSARPRDLATPLPHRYRVGDQLGEGGMGQVWAAHDDTLGRQVAIKVVPEELRRNPELKGRFIREAQAAARLRHPNIVQVFDVDVEGGFIVMELVPGESLQRRIERGKLPPAEVRRIGAALLEALGEAHRHGIIHRDVKPANVLLEPSGQVKLADFGVASVGNSELTTPGVSIGTPAFMAPEQLRGLKVDQRADVYSVGVTLFEAAVGERLHLDFDRGSPRRRVARATGDGALAAVLKRALEAKPERRFPSAEAFSEALRAEGGKSSLRSPRGLAAGFAALALAGALTGAVAYQRLFARPPIPTGALSTAVLPFDDQSGLPQLDFAREGLAQLLATELERAGFATFTRAQLASDGASPAALRSSAVEQGAQLLVAGRLSREGEKVRVQVRLEDPQGRALFHEDALVLPSEVPDAVRGLLPRLAAAGGKAAPASAARAVSFAYERELRLGQAELESHELGAARVHLERAVAEEPLQGEAKYLLAIVGWWEGNEPAVVEVVIQQALNTADLSVAQRNFLAGLQLFLREKFEEAWTYFKAQSAAFPNDRDLLYGRFESELHSGRPEEAAATYRQIARRWPGFRTGMFHAFDYYEARGDAEGMTWVLSRYPPRKDALNLVGAVRKELSLRAYDRGLAVIDDYFAARGGSAPDPILTPWQLKLQLLSGRADAARGTRDRLHEAFRSTVLSDVLGAHTALGDASARAATRLALLEYAAKAQRELDRTAALADVVLLELGDRRAEDLRELREKLGPTYLERINASPGPALLSLYLSEALGDEATVAERAKSPFSEVRAAALGHAAATRREWKAAAEAFAKAQALAGDARYGLIHAWYRARAHAEAGELAEASAACDDVIQPRVFRWAWASLAPKCWLLQAEAHRARANFGQARAALEQVLTLRAEASPEDPEVAAARKALAALPGN